MATGKSTLGRGLVNELGPHRASFADLDSAVEAEAGVSISTLFATRGEEFFRALESAALRRLTEEPRQPGEELRVIACGGGTPCREENMDYMLRHGTVVEITAPPHVIMRRVLLAPEGQRPLLDALRHCPEALLAEIKTRYASRRQHYARAHASFDGSRLETEDEIRRAARDFIHILITRII